VYRLVENGVLSSAQVFWDKCHYITHVAIVGPFIIRAKPEYMLNPLYYYLTTRGYICRQLMPIVDIPDEPLKAPPF